MINSNRNLSEPNKKRTLANKHKCPLPQNKTSITSKCFVHRTFQINGEKKIRLRKHSRNKNRQRLPKNKLHQGTNLPGTSPTNWSGDNSMYSKNTSKQLQNCVSELYKQLVNSHTTSLEQKEKRQMVKAV